jgi:hypothetical protein
MKVSTHRYVLPPVLLAIHAILLLPLSLPPRVFRCGGVHAGYSVPLGMLGFAVVYASKQLAGKVPLPKDPRRKRLAQGIELVVLFSMGIVEEVCRWGLVRALVGLEGGEGGFRGTAFLGLGWEDDGGGTGPSIWKGVYFMGWVWSLVECTVCRILFHISLRSWFIRVAPSLSACDLIGRCDTLITGNESAPFLTSL